MSDLLLLAIVLGVVVLACAVDLAVLVAWLRSLWRGARH
jgi:hypothetical protein